MLVARWSFSCRRPACSSPIKSRCRGGRTRAAWPAVRRRRTRRVCRSIRCSPAYRPRRGCAPTAVLVRSDAAAPVEVTLGRDRRAFVNAYTGAVLGEGSYGDARLLPRRHGLASHGRRGGRPPRVRPLDHRLRQPRLLLHRAERLFLWWPRTWTRARLRNIALFRRGTSGKARDFNWHNTIGVWSFVPLVAIVGSGVVMSYPWANALVYRAMGEQPPQQQQPAAAALEGQDEWRRGTRGEFRRRGRERGSAEVHRDVTLEPRLRDSPSSRPRQMPDWRSISIQLPSAIREDTDGVARRRAPAGSHNCAAPRDHRSARRPSRVGSRSRADAGSPTAFDPPLRAHRRSTRMAGQTIAGLVSLGAVILGWTGIALALRRLRGRGVAARRACADARTAAWRNGEPELEPVG